MTCPFQLSLSILHQVPNLAGDFVRDGDPLPAARAYGEIAILDAWLERKVATSASADLRLVMVDNPDPMPAAAVTERSATR